MKDTIENIAAREILSGVGRPTIEVQLTTRRGIAVTASVPSGTSKGVHEAYELYDGGKRFRGLGVRKAVANVNEFIAPAVKGKNVMNQREIDTALIELDNTENKSRLGANAILAVSLASIKAGAKTCGLPCYRYIGGKAATRLPVPLATVLAGGEHAPSQLDFEDYLLILNGFETFSDALEALVETRIVLGEILNKKFGAVPDIGGALSPPIDDDSQAFDFMLEAINKAGFQGKIALGLDVAASSFYVAQRDLYKVAGREWRTNELLDYYIKLTNQYPLEFIEDPFHQDDFEAFSLITSALPGKKIVGDDLFVTNAQRINRGIETKACNCLLLKINQVGTITEACDAGELATRNQYTLAVSMRSSDTNDSFISDLAVGLGAEQIKLGSPVRGERNAKYNRLLAIEQELGKEAFFSGGSGKQGRKTEPAMGEK